MPFGSVPFFGKAITRIEGVIGEVPKMQRRAQAKPLDWYMRSYSSRDEGIVSAYYLMKDMTDEFNVHYSAVS